MAFPGYTSLTSLGDTWHSPATPLSRPIRASRVQGAYPDALLVTTVIGGVLLSLKLAGGAPDSSADDDPGDDPHSNDSDASPTVWWILLAAHAGRAALLFEPSLLIYMDGALVAAALTQPLAMPPVQGPTHTRVHTMSAPLGSAADGEGVGVMAMRLALLVFAMYRAHTTLLAPAATYVFATAPSPPMLLGTTIALLSAGIHLLSAGLSTPATRTLAARLCLWLLAAGGAFGMLQPELDGARLVEALLWALFHPAAPLANASTALHLLPPWLLTALILVASAAALGLVPFSRAPLPLQLAAFASAGACAALTVAATCLPLERLLYLLIAIAASLAGAFLGSIVSPTALVQAPRVPAALLALLLALLPAGLGIISHTFRHAPVSRTSSATPLYRAAWAALYAGVLTAGALLCRVHAGAITAADADASTSAAPRPSVRGMAARESEHRHAWRRARLGWLTSVGTLCTITSLAILIAINHASGGGARSVVPMTALLLLLPPRGPSPPFARYVPVVLAALAVVVTAAAIELIERLVANGLGRVAIRGIALAACALPAIVLAAKFSLDRREAPTPLLWCVFLVALVPCLLAHSRPLYDLGGAAIVAGIAHLYLAQRLHAEGLKPV